MATFGGFYVPVSSNPEDRKRTVKNYFLEAEVTGSSEHDHFSGKYLEISLGPTNANPPEEELRKLSLEIADDIIWMASQSVVDAFQYIRWNDGELKRALTYGCHGSERTWERVEGTPESWEKEILFTEDNRKFELDCDDSLEAKALIDLAWEHGVIKIGSTIPIISSRELCWEIGYHFEIYA